MPLEAPFTLNTQKQFTLCENSITEFENYAKMLFEGVE